MAFKKTLLHYTDLFFKLRYLFGTFKMIWPVAPNQGFLSPDLGFHNAFLGFSSEDLVFLGFNCVVVI